MKLPTAVIIDMLESQMTEERCDAVAHRVSKFTSDHGGFIGKLAGGIVYGALDAATPELLFKALHEAFPDGHTVEVPAGAEVTE